MSDWKLKLIFASVIISILLISFIFITDYNNKLIFILVTVPILLGIFLSYKEMSIAVIAISLALCFTNIDKFARFKGVGFEAELRTAVDKAYAAIGQLKELGLSLSSPIVDELAVSGRWMQYIPLKYKLKLVEKIADNLKKLGASQQEIEEVCSSIYDRIKEDHLRRILQSLKKANPGRETLFEGIDDWNMDNWDKNKILEFLKKEKLNKDKETEEDFLDLDYFLKNKKLRREDKWQS